MIDHVSHMSHSSQRAPKKRGGERHRAVRVHGPNQIPIGHPKNLHVAVAAAACQHGPIGAEGYGVDLSMRGETRYGGKQSTGEHGPIGADSAESYRRNHAPQAWHTLTPEPQPHRQRTNTPPEKTSYYNQKRGSERLQHGVSI